MVPVSPGHLPFGSSDSWEEQGLGQRNASVAGLAQIGMYVTDTGLPYRQERQKPGVMVVMMITTNFYCVLTKCQRLCCVIYVDPHI
jgi:hypothetical protein